MNYFNQCRLEALINDYNFHKHEASQGYESELSPRQWLYSEVMGLWEASKYLDATKESIAAYIEQVSFYNAVKEEFLNEVL